MKLAIVVGTRPEIIRLSSTINLCRNIFETTLIHTGQNYDYTLNEIFFEDLDVEKPDYYLDCSRENAGKAIGDIIAKSYELFTEIKPDCVLILGDTNSCLCAYSAKRLKIPIFHLEAGNRCFDPNVPEEINRKIIDHLSDVNICYMEHARRNLLQEGLPSKFIFVLGSPIPEVLMNIKDKLDTSTILERFGLAPSEYFVWSSHREENVDLSKNLHNIVRCIHILSKIYQKKIFFTVHPRTRKHIEREKITFDDNVILSKPIGLIDYYQLQRNALCVISDSGTVTEESKILNFRALLLRSSTEHPEGVEAGSIVLQDNNCKFFKEAVDLCLRLDSSSDIIHYKDTNFSEKVCKIISGYTSLVDKYVWMKL